MNFYGGSGSRVRWHSDDEDLFGKRGESKVIVSMSSGASKLFKWKPGPSPDSDASSSWLHHGDLFVMDGRCQDEYLFTVRDPLQGGERVNITFRWIRNHVPRCPLAAGVVCCLPTCVKGSSVPTNAGSSLPGVSAPGESAGFGGMGVIPCGSPRLHQLWIAMPFFALHSSCWRGSVRVRLLRFCSELWGRTLVEFLEVTTVMGISGCWMR